MKTGKADSTGLSPDPLYEAEVESYCPVCHGAGYLHPLKDGKPDYSTAVTCECRREQLEKEAKEHRLRMCSLPVSTETWTFDNFKIDKRWPKLKEAKDAATALASGKADFRWLILQSGVDRGKSHLAVAICRQWLEQGRAACYIFVPIMLDNLRAGYNDHTYDDKIEYYKNVELLVLDDIGLTTNKDGTSPWANEKLMIIINHRLEAGLHMVVTTNKDLKNLPGDEEHRIGSRLLRYPATKIININAPEFRLPERKSIN